MAARMNFGLSEHIAEEKFKKLAARWEGAPGLYEAIERMGSGAEPQPKDIGWLCEAFGWDVAGKAAKRLERESLPEAGLFAAAGPGGAEAACRIGKLASMPEGWAELCVAEILSSRQDESEKGANIEKLAGNFELDLSASVAREGCEPLSPLARCRPDQRRAGKSWLFWGGYGLKSWGLYAKLARMGARESDPEEAMNQFYASGMTRDGISREDGAWLLPLWMESGAGAGSHLAWSIAVECGLPKELGELVEPAGVDWWACEPVSLLARAAFNGAQWWQGERALAIGERALAQGRVGARALHQALGALEYASFYAKNLGLDDRVERSREEMAALCERARAQNRTGPRGRSVVEALAEAGAIKKAGGIRRERFVEEAAKLAYASESVAPVCEAVGVAFAAGEGGLVREVLAACAAAVERAEISEMLDEARAAEEREPAAAPSRPARRL